MVSFDIFCEPHMECVKRAVAEANAMVPKRYDWRDKPASYHFTTHERIVLKGQSYLQLDQMLGELCRALRRELVSLAFIRVNKPHRAAGQYSVRLTIEKGITRSWASYLIGQIAGIDPSAQCTFQNGEVHVETEKLDDAQKIITQLRITFLDIPIHFRELTAH